MTLVSDILRTKKSLERIQIELWAKAHIAEFNLDKSKEQELIDHWYEEVIPVRFPVKTKEDVDQWSKYLKQSADSEASIRRYWKEKVKEHNKVNALLNAWDF